MYLLNRDLAIRAYLSNRNLASRKQEESLKKQQALDQERTREEVAAQALKIKNLKHQKSD